MQDVSTEHKHQVCRAEEETNRSRRKWGFKGEARCHRSAQKPIYRMGEKKTKKKTTLLLFKIPDFFFNTTPMVQVSRISGTKHSKEVLWVHTYWTKKRVKRDLWEQHKQKPKFKTFPRRTSSWRFERPTSFSSSLWCSSLHKNCDVSTQNFHF